MKLLVLCLVVAAAGAYQVHEDIEENDETVRGKRQETSTYIDSILNIPIGAIKQTSSPANAAANIDSVLKIPVTTLQAVSSPIKTRQEQASSTTSRSIRRQDSDESSPVDDREELRRRMYVERARQRVWEEQVHRRRMDQLQWYNNRMQDRILEEDQRSSYYKDPYGFSAFTKWIVGHPHRVLGGHAGGHGDGHVYQYYNRDKPMFFGGQQQGTRQQVTTPSTTATPSSTPSLSTTASSVPTHIYAVQEVVDESGNTFAWPNWFGIINVLKKPAQDPEYFKYKYAQARKNSQAKEQELTGNELDADVPDSQESQFPAAN